MTEEIPGVVLKPLPFLLGRGQVGVGLLDSGPSLNADLVPRAADPAGQELSRLGQGGGALPVMVGDRKSVV